MSMSGLCVFKRSLSDSGKGGFALLSSVTKEKLPSLRASGHNRERFFNFYNFAIANGFIVRRVFCGPIKTVLIEVTITGERSRFALFILSKCPT